MIQVYMFALIQGYYGWDLLCLGFMVKLKILIGLSVKFFGSSDARMW